MNPLSIAHYSEQYSFVEILRYKVEPLNTEEGQRWMKQMLLAIKQMNSTEQITNATMDGNLIKKVGTNGKGKKKYWKQTSVANETKRNRH